MKYQEVLVGDVVSSGAIAEFALLNFCLFEE